jgi:hypothetical protein
MNEEVESDRNCFRIVVFDAIEFDSYHFHLLCNGPSTP